MRTIDTAASATAGTKVPAARRRIVIVGAGFGGLTAAAALGREEADITLIDRSNHHLFQPLLYQVATAGLSPTQIASPIRTILRRQANTRVVLGEVTGIDLERNTVACNGAALAFDDLILATGATHAYFGRDDWAPFAPGLKTLDDAVGLRRRVLLAFEAAEITTDPVERERLLTFVVVGAGPTGVEVAGAVAELARRALTCDFRAIRGSMARVVLVEAGQRVLPSFCPTLSTYARRALEKLGVEVRLETLVTDCDAGGVQLSDRRLEAGNIIWAAGVRASPVARWLDRPSDRAGRVRVHADLSVAGHCNVFVIGDACLIPGVDGRPVPGVAPAAKQQGAYVAEVLRARLAGRPPPRAFRYRDAGSLATIGRGAAVAQLGPLRFTGVAAWLFWCLAHIYFLVGFRNRLTVGIDWLVSYLTFERGSRLITGAAEPSRSMS